MPTRKLVTWATGYLGLVMLASPSIAADWYAGASVGQAEASGFGLSDLDDGSLVSGSVDDSDTGWTIYGGARLHKFFSLEANTFELGTFRIDAVSDGTGTDFAAGPVSTVASVDGYSLSALGLLPVGNSIDLFARVGYFDIEVDTTVTDTTGSVGSGSSDTGVMYGIGAQYNFSAPFTVRVQWDRYDTIEEVDFFSIAAHFRFGGK